VPVFPRLLDVMRMMNNPAEYECAKAAYIAEEGREGGPTAADEAEDEFDVEY
jgi:hypothetical protein